jgi:uncharacterized protein YbjT (DUF2867 family)
MILITGASGSVGKAVLQEAIRKESKVRGMFRSKEEAAKAPSGCAAVLADYSDKQSLRNALDGMSSVYVVCSPIPQLVELESNMLDVCKESGVKHVVLNSAMGAGDYGKSFPSWHRKVEDKLKATGMSYTILRPNGFLQNIVAFNAPSIRAQGAFYVAMGDAKHKNPFVNIVCSMFAILVARRILMLPSPKIRSAMHAAARPAPYRSGLPSVLPGTTSNRVQAGR